MSHLHPLPSPRSSVPVAATIYVDHVCVWATNQRTNAAVLVLQNALHHLTRKLDEAGFGVAATKTRFTLFRAPHVRVLPIVLTVNGISLLFAVHMRHTDFLE